MLNEKSHLYLFNLIPNFNRVHNTRLSYYIPPIKVRHDYFQNLFFPSPYQTGTSLSSTTETHQVSTLLKKKLLHFIHFIQLLHFIRPCANIIFHIHNPLGIKLLTRLRLGLSHLHEHKFRHCFQDTFNLSWEFGKDTELTMHFFLHCTNFLIPRQTLFEKMRNNDDNILSQCESQLIQTLLYSNQNYHSSINRLIINQPSNNQYQLKDSNACILTKTFCKKACARNFL